jgi:hypothetical protein
MKSGGQKEESCQLEDVRKDRDAWRGQADANQRLLATRRGVFGWGAKQTVSALIKVLMFET